MGKPENCTECGEIFYPAKEGNVKCADCIRKEILQRAKNEIRGEKAPVDIERLKWIGPTNSRPYIGDREVTDAELRWLIENGHFPKSNVKGEK